jgi:arabinoxylan arabinofuranohydrolase
MEIWRDNIQKFDPSILVDNDGRIWLYSGSSQTTVKNTGHPMVGCFVMELETDMPAKE